MAHLRAGLTDVRSGSNVLELSIDKGGLRVRTIRDDDRVWPPLLMTELFIVGRLASFTWCKEGRAAIVDAAELTTLVMAHAVDQATVTITVMAGGRASIAIGDVKHALRRGSGSTMGTAYEDLAQRETVAEMGVDVRQLDEIVNVTYAGTISLGIEWQRDALFIADLDPNCGGPASPRYVLAAEVRRREGAQSMAVRLAPRQREGFVLRFDGQNLAALRRALSTSCTGAPPSGGAPDGAASAMVDHEGALSIAHPLMVGKNIVGILSVFVEASLDRNKR